MRSKGISAEQFDSLWVKCSQHRFQQIKQSVSTQEVLKDWPEYKLSSGYRFVSSLQIT